MNKKMLASAIIVAMAAPLAAQAGDGLKVSGRAQVEAISGATNIYADYGESRLVLDYGMGDFYARAGWDIAAGPTKVPAKGFAYRDVYIGYKLGNYKVQYGTMAAATKGIEGDKFAGTFLELRRSAYSASGGFSADTLGVRGKIGDMKVAFDYVTAGGMGLSAKADSWFLGWNDAGNMKAGYNIRGFQLGYDTDGTNDSIIVDYGMKMAGGKLNVSFATRGVNAANPMYRVAYMGKLGDARIHAGISQNGTKNEADALVMGVGLRVKF